MTYCLDGLDGLEWLEDFNFCKVKKLYERKNLTFCYVPESILLFFKRY